MSSRFLALDISKRGIRQPLIMTQDGVVVSGHRRLAAAKLAGFAEVPCVVQHDADDAKMAVEMTLDNAPRKGPFTQLMAHALVLKDIVEPILRARERHEDPSALPGYASVAPIIDLIAGGRVANFTPGEQTFDGVKNFTRPTEGGRVNSFTRGEHEFGRVKNFTRVRWEDVVGKLIGMGGRTLRSGMEIYLAAMNGDERAEDLCVKIDEGEFAINGAYKAFKSSRKASAERSETADEGPDEALGLDLSEDGGEDPEESEQDETDRKVVEELTQAMKASLPARGRAEDKPAAGDKPLDFARCMYYARDALRAGDYGVGPLVAEMMKEYLRAARAKHGDEGIVGGVIDAGLIDERLAGFKISLWARASDIGWWDEMTRHLSQDVPIMGHFEGRWEDDAESQ